MEGEEKAKHSNDKEKNEKYGGGKGFGKTENPRLAIRLQY